MLQSNWAGQLKLSKFKKLLPVFTKRHGQVHLHLNEIVPIVLCTKGSSEFKKCNVTSDLWTQHMSRHCWCWQWCHCDINISVNSYNTLIHITKKLCMVSMNTGHAWLQSTQAMFSITTSWAWFSCSKAIHVFFSVLVNHLKSGFTSMVFHYCAVSKGTRKPDNIYSNQITR